MASREATFFGPDEGHWLGWLGHKIRYLAVGNATAGRFCLSDAEVPQGGGAPPHLHEFGEAFYVLDGSVRFVVGDQSFDLDAGDFVHVPGGAAHYPEVLSNSGAKLITLAAPAGFDDFQFRAGQRLRSSDDSIEVSKEDVVTEAKRIAAEYAIDMQPDDSALERRERARVCRRGEGDVIDAVGDRYRFLATGESTDGRYAIWHATIGPGGGPPLHRHTREDEAFYVLEGEIRFESDGQTFVGEPGSFVNLPADGRHRFVNPTDAPAEALILVAPAGLETMFRRTGTLIRDVSSPITGPREDEKERLLRIAPEYGVEL